MTSREELAESVRYHQRRANALRSQVDPLRVALDYSMPILERACEGESWDDEESAREAVRLAERALTMPQIEEPA